MVDQKKRTYHSDASALLPLKMVLIAAERESPARAPKRGPDVNEQLALKLIGRMKKQFQKSRLFVGMRLMEKTIVQDAVLPAYFAANARIEDEPTKRLED